MKLLTNKLFLISISLIMILIGLYMNINLLFYIGVGILMPIIFLLFTFAWILNPICSLGGKIILKGFRRPIFQIPFCLPRYSQNKNMYFIKTVMFDSSVFTNDGDHINKLFGFTIGNILERSIHKNSFRFGWRIYKGKIQIVDYYYIDGKRYYNILANILPNIHYDICINRDDKGVKFTLLQSRNEISKHYVSFNHKSGYGYMCGLYYGGKPKAPHKIKVELW